MITRNDWFHRLTVTYTPSPNVSESLSFQISIDTDTLDYNIKAAKRKVTSRPFHEKYHALLEVEGGGK